MLTREYQTHLTESKGLYKQLSKLYNKVKTLHKECEKSHKKYLSRLHPRSLTHRSRFDKDYVPENKNGAPSTNTLAKKAFLAEPTQFSPIPLYRTDITTEELFKEHIFLSKSKTGSVVLKNELNMEWKNFEDLPFQRRRELLLSVFEDLHWALNSTSVMTTHIKELLIKGYPESILGKIKDNLAYLKIMSQQEELLVLSKVTIANQVKSFLDSLARLVRILKDAKGISKSFYNCIKSCNKHNIYVHFLNTQFDNRPRSSETNRTDSVPSKLDDLKVKLLIPFPIATDPIQDRFIMSTL